MAMKRSVRLAQQQRSYFSRPHHAHSELVPRQEINREYVLYGFMVLGAAAWYQAAHHSLYGGSESEGEQSPEPSPIASFGAQCRSLAQQSHARHWREDASVAAHAHLSRRAFAVGQLDQVPLDAVPQLPDFLHRLHARATDEAVLASSYTPSSRTPAATRPPPSTGELSGSQRSAPDVRLPQQANRRWNPIATDSRALFQRQQAQHPPAVPAVQSQPHRALPPTGASADAAGSAQGSPQRPGQQTTEVHVSVLDAHPHAPGAWPTEARREGDNGLRDGQPETAVGPFEPEQRLQHGSRSLTPEATLAPQASQFDADVRVTGRIGQSQPAECLTADAEGVGRPGTSGPSGEVSLHSDISFAPAAPRPPLPEGATWGLHSESTHGVYQRTPLSGGSTVSIHSAESHGGSGWVTNPERSLLLSDIALVSGSSEIPTSGEPSPDAIPGVSDDTASAPLPPSSPHIGSIAPGTRRISFPGDPQGLDSAHSITSTVVTGERDAVSPSVVIPGTRLPSSAPSGPPAPSSPHIGSIPPGTRRPSFAGDPQGPDSAHGIPVGDNADVVATGGHSPHAFAGSGMSDAAASPPSSPHIGSIPPGTRRPSFQGDPAGRGRADATTSSETAGLESTADPGLEAHSHGAPCASSGAALERLVPVGYAPSSQPTDGAADTSRHESVSLDTELHAVAPSVESADAALRTLPSLIVPPRVDPVEPATPSLCTSAQTTPRHELPRSSESPPALPSPSVSPRGLRLQLALLDPARSGCDAAMERQAACATSTGAPLSATPHWRRQSRQPRGSRTARGFHEFQPSLTPGDHVWAELQNAMKFVRSMSPCAETLSPRAVHQERTSGTTADGRPRSAPQLSFEHLDTDLAACTPGGDGNHDNVTSEPVDTESAADLANGSQAAQELQMTAVGRSPLNRNHKQGAAVQSPRVGEKMDAGPQATPQATAAAAGSLPSRLSLEMPGRAGSSNWLPGGAAPGVEATSCTPADAQPGTSIQPVHAGHAPLAADADAPTAPLPQRGTMHCTDGHSPGGKPSRFEPDDPDDYKGLGPVSGHTTHLLAIPTIDPRGCPLSLGKHDSERLRGDGSSPQKESAAASASQRQGSAVPNVFSEGWHLPFSPSSPSATNRSTIATDSVFSTLSAALDSVSTNPTMLLRTLSQESSVVWSAEHLQVPSQDIDAAVQHHDGVSGQDSPGQAMEAKEGKRLRGHHRVRSAVVGDSLSDAVDVSPRDPDASDLGTPAPNLSRTQTDERAVLTITMSQSGPTHNAPVHPITILCNAQMSSLLEKWMRHLQSQPDQAAAVRACCDGLRHVARALATPGSSHTADSLLQQLPACSALRLSLRSGQREIVSLQLQVPEGHRTEQVLSPSHQALLAEDTPTPGAINGRGTVVHAVLRNLITLLCDPPSACLSTSTLELHNVLCDIKSSIANALQRMKLGAPRYISPGISRQLPTWVLRVLILALARKRLADPDTEYNCWQLLQMVHQSHALNVEVEDCALPPPPPKHVILQMFPLLPSTAQMIAEAARELLPDVDLELVLPPSGTAPRTPFSTDGPPVNVLVVPPLVHESLKVVSRAMSSLQGSTLLPAMPFMNLPDGLLNTGDHTRSQISEASHARTASAPQLPVMSPCPTMRRNSDAVSVPADAGSGSSGAASHSSVDSMSLEIPSALWDCMEMQTPLDVLGRPLSARLHEPERPTAPHRSVTMPIDRSQQPSMDVVEAATDTSSGDSKPVDSARAQVPGSPARKAHPSYTPFSSPLAKGPIAEFENASDAAHRMALQTAPPDVSFGKRQAAPASSAPTGLRRQLALQPPLEQPSRWRAPQAAVAGTSSAPVAQEDSPPEPVILRPLQPHSTFVQRTRGQDPAHSEKQQARQERRRTSPAQKPAAPLRLRSAPAVAAQQRSSVSPRVTVRGTRDTAMDDSSVSSLGSRGKGSKRGSNMAQRRWR